VGFDSIDVVMIERASDELKYRLFVKWHNGAHEIRRLTRFANK